MQQFSVRNERSIALMVAILALVVIGAIVANTFFISTVEQPSRPLRHSRLLKPAYRAARRTGT